MRKIKRLKILCGSSVNSVNNNCCARGMYKVLMQDGAQESVKVFLQGVLLLVFVWIGVRIT